MKKFLGIVVLSLILFSETVIAKQTKWVTGQTYEDEITWRRNLKIKLPPGKFELVERYSWTGWGIEAKTVDLVSVKNNIVDKWFLIGEMGSWTYQSQVRQILHEILYKNKYDGCYPRGEYTLVKVRKKGNLNNCLIVAHVDTKKVLYYPDNPQDNSKNIIKLWVKKNNIEVPPVLLCSVHYFMAPSIIDNLLKMEFCINPDLNGASKTKFNTEETSEYHPSNIHQYPDKKKYMEEWIKLAAKRHKLFEIGIGAKERHKLDLSEFGVGEIIKETKTTTSNSGLTEELKELHNLYKEGVLTKEEFEKAKKKILNQ